MAIQRQLRVLNAGEFSGPGVIRAAFASSDLKSVDQHFGSAQRFAIYAVEETRATLLEVVEFGALGQDGDENKLLEKFVVLDGCAAVYCVQAGGSATRQLLQMGVQPFRVPEGIPITVLLNNLQQEWRGGPSGWLARVLGGTQKKTMARFDAMEAEGWNE